MGCIITGEEHEVCKKCNILWQGVSQPVVDPICCKSSPEKWSRSRLSGPYILSIPNKNVQGSWWTASPNKQYHPEKIQVSVTNGEGRNKVGYK